jgi:cytoskeleton protein RodZ
MLRSPTPAPSPPPALAATNEPAVTLPTDRVYPPPSPSAAPAEVPITGMVLAIQVRRNCWVAVQADGVRVLDRVMAEGELHTLNAKKEIVLSVGNAGGVAIKLNGQPGVALGQEGQVRRNIVITPQSLPSLVQAQPAGNPRS